MGKKLLTGEEIEMLRSNPYTYSVTSHTLFLTKEFKELFWKAYQSGGASAHQILEQHGYRVEFFGQRRIWGIVQSIKEQQLSAEGLDGYSPRKARGRVKREGQSTEDRVEYRENKILYMEQQIEFLKKLYPSEIRESRCNAYEGIFMIERSVLSLQKTESLSLTKLTQTGYNRRRRALLQGGQPMLSTAMLTVWVMAERSTRFCGE